MYPTVLIIIFMLFFAILAYGWFYWQRAKSRTPGEVSSADSASAEAPAADAGASQEMATASSSSSDQQ